MPRPMTEKERQAFVDEAHVAVLSVAGDDGRPPLSVPVWYHYEPGGNIAFFTGTQGRRARKIALIERAGMVSLCVQREELPHRYATIEGTVVGTDRPPAAEQMLPIARRYLPEEAAQGFIALERNRPGTELVLYTVRPDRWLTADFSSDVG